MLGHGSYEMIPPIHPDKYPSDPELDARTIAGYYMIDLLDTTLTIPLKEECGVVSIDSYQRRTAAFDVLDMSHSQYVDFW
ncbi:MAG: hypothetical protein P0116_16940 [Candidatus Nitrosocosmicus sp.]|nr:hypothetical protein [Candidatus Nitrosocosmicus sp.]